MVLLLPIFSLSNVTTSYIHTYIHNWPLQPFSQDYGLVSHTAHVVCVNFISKQRYLQFNVDSERQIFKKFLHGNFIALRVFARHQLRGNRRKNIYFFHISF